MTVPPIPRNRKPLTIVLGNDGIANGRAELANVEMWAPPERFAQIATVPGSLARI
jgi:hypothetical protein